jgi:methyl-accepting chemotaxis protein
MWLRMSPMGKGDDMSNDYDKVLELIRRQLKETREQSAALREMARTARRAAENARHQAQMVRKLAQMVTEEAKASDAQRRSLADPAAPKAKAKPKPPTKK